MNWTQLLKNEIETTYAATGGWPTLFFDLCIHSNSGCPTLS